MTRARVKALHNEVNSLLTTLDLGTPLDGLLPHADVLCVIRYKEHQDHGEEDKPRSREGEKQLDMEMIMKPKPTSLEALRGRDGRPVQTRSDRTHNRRPVTPGQPGANGPAPSCGRRPDRTGNLAIPGLRRSRTHDRTARPQARSDRTHDRTARSQARSDRKPDLTGMPHQTALTYPFAYLFALAGHSLASCDCLDSHLKTFVIHGVQGRKHEARFTAHIFKNGMVLKSYGIVYSHSDYVAEDGSDGSSSSDDVVDDGSDGSSSSDVVEDGSDGSSSSDDAVEDGSDGSSSNDDVVEDGSDGSSSSDDVIVEEGPTSGSVGEGNAPSGGSSGSDDAEVERRPMSGTVGEGNAPLGGSSGKYVFAHPAFPCWSFQNAINLSVEDPFYVMGPVMARIDIVGGETTR
ncbi:hypothetical protein QYE76_064878 [Lolium multiflorum]|uniref:FBD domain-containing protein n=1 Tax=Lolium multiflorum TaxID=4521 RepID=A0AAD8W8C2_LOLMU|nr:hypothetical protein QYE76_064878 [Lolium multiflorum]